MILLRLGSPGIFSPAIVFRLRSKLIDGCYTLGSESLVKERLVETNGCWREAQRDRQGREKRPATEELRY
jgi:hypothetical protein